MFIPVPIEILKITEVYLLKKKLDTIKWEIAVYLALGNRYEKYSLPIILHKSLFAFNGIMSHRVFIHITSH
jgi:hypothetical protein